jgi:hypothetical protein
MAATSWSQLPRAINKAYSRDLFGTEWPGSALSVTLQFLPNSFLWPTGAIAEHASWMMPICGCEGNSKKAK